MASKIQVVPVVRDHVATLRDARTARPRVGDILTHYALPVSLGIAIPMLGVRMTDGSQYVAGAAILAGLSFALAVYVFQLRLEAQRDPRIPREAVLLDLIDELFTNVCYSMLVGLALAAVTIAASAYSRSGAPAGPVVTGIVIALGIHYLITILMCIKRLRAAYLQLTT